MNIKKKTNDYGRSWILTFFRSRNCARIFSNNMKKLFRKWIEFFRDFHKQPIVPFVYNYKRVWCVRLYTLRIYTYLFQNMCIFKTQFFRDEHLIFNCIQMQTVETKRSVYRVVFSITVSRDFSYFYLRSL